ncbi:hypothetical protein GCM10010124_41230 [Pilimelia terevasa]|uniref:Pyrrolo-quinoline quinone repeat domain-containing protein n=1 Tax=Pilimelia terevasa TaxID=53372 RepID=A0A8J3BVW4_9ACTN|nr:PQQ-binding-like beta-propeller repeat protein [Pilimelia terevasa]GGK44169.1 hypothetical protein GCM10010124_41230 [Pilimelia terevasa]
MRPLDLGDRWVLPTTDPADTLRTPLTCLDAATGAVVWAYPIELVETTARSGTDVLAATAHGEVVAMDPAAGTCRWRWVADRPFRSVDLLVTRGRVYVVGDDTLFILDAATGRPEGDPVTSAGGGPAADEDTLYLRIGDELTAWALP